MQPNKNDVLRYSKLVYGIIWSTIIKDISTCAPFYFFDGLGLIIKYTH